MTELEQLVGRYVRDEVRYADFRRSFVPLLAVESPDRQQQAAVEVIESSCADMSDGLIGEDQLKRRMAQAVNPRVPQVGTQEVPVAEIQVEILEPAVVRIPQQSGTTIPSYGCELQSSFSSLVTWQLVTA